MGLIIILVIVIAAISVKLSFLNSEIEHLRDGKFDMNQDDQVDNSDLSEYISGFNKHKQ